MEADATIPPTTTSTTLEIQEGEGGNWKPVGPIHLLDDPSSASSSHSTNAPATAPNPNPSPPTPPPPSSSSYSSHRIELLLSIKHLLSPYAKVKSHRKANYLYRHSSDKIDTNLVLYLHGAGDSHIPYHSLAKTMNLPQCCSLSLSASCMGEGFVKLPLGLGYTWFHQMDYTTGNALSESDGRRIQSLKSAIDKLEVLLEALMECWVPERIFLWGFSAGACLVMEMCRHRIISGKRALGGAICIAGGCSTAFKMDTIVKTSTTTNHMEVTPVLLLGGSRDDKFPPHALQAARDSYNNACDSSREATKKAATTMYIHPGKGHAMVQSPEEMKVVMEFFSQHMVKQMVGWNSKMPFAKNTAG